MATTVAVLGGGVGGLSAAHELVERGFSVTVYEKRALPGGKARSYPSPEGRPAEHGFRFFPAFYRHLPDTMARIPSGNGSARDRLVGAERILLARAGGANELVAPAHAPESLADLAVLARFVFDAATQLGVPAVDVAWLLERLFTLLASCDERRVEQWDLESWWSYVQADKRSEEFRRYLADGLTRTLVAARAKEMSARTGGLILVQLLLDLSRAGDRADRVLDAPTSEAWIGPWVAYLRSKGVAVRLGEGVEGLVGARRSRGQRDGRRAAGRGRLLRGGAARGGHAHAALARAARRRAAAERAGPPGHALDERDHVLPRRGPASGPRSRDLSGLRVGADLDLAAPVLAAASTSTGSGSAACCRSTSPSGSARVV